MALVPCDWFYEYMLGDNCDNKCNECYANKDIRICKEDFEVAGEMLEKITIKKGSWWSLVFMNNDHVLLDNLDGRQLTLKRDLFDLYFENFIYDAKLEQDTVPFDFDLYQAGLMDMPEEMIKVLNKIRAEIEQLPTNTRTNWNGCCPDIDYPEIEYVDIPKKALLDIIDKYITGGDNKE